MNPAYDMSEGGETVVPRFAMTQFTVEEFFKFWPQLEEMLDSLPHTWRRLTKEHIYQSVANDLMQVWGIGRPPAATLVLLTTVSVYPAMRVLNIVWAAGTFEEGMVPLLDAALTGYARLNGCAEMEVVGRPGWEPIFRRAGYTGVDRVWNRKVENIHMN